MFWSSLERYAYHAPLALYLVLLVRTFQFWWLFACIPHAYAYRNSQGASRLLCICHRGSIRSNLKTSAACVLMRLFGSTYTVMHSREMSHCLFSKAAITYHASCVQWFLESASSRPSRSSADGTNPGVNLVVLEESGVKDVHSIELPIDDKKSAHSFAPRNEKLSFSWELEWIHTFHAPKRCRRLVRIVLCFFKQFCEKSDQCLQTLNIKRWQLYTRSSCRSMTRKVRTRLLLEMKLSFSWELEWIRTLILYSSRLVRIIFMLFQQSVF